MDQVSKNVAAILLKNKAVLLNTNTPFTYASGIRSPIYCDNRVLISNVADRKVVIDAFVDRLSSMNTLLDVVAGTATAGIPWACWIAERLAKPMIYVRSSSKGHGRQNAIEGNIADKQNLVVIEDLISTGGSSLQVVDLLREAGHVVNSLVAIFSYELSVAKNHFAQKQVQASTLTCFGDLLDVALDERVIDESQKQNLLEWRQDPQSWAQKYGYV